MGRKVEKIGLVIRIMDNSKQKQARFTIMIYSVALQILGLGLSVAIPIINGIDVGNFILFGMIATTIGLTIWSFQTMNKKDKKKDRSPISSRIYYVVIIAVSITLLILNMIITDFDMTQNLPLAKDFNLNENDAKATVAMTLLLIGIIVYYKYFKKKRGSKGVVRRGWNEQQKSQVRNRQNGKCAKCGDSPPRWEYHHKDGDRSNNAIWNCQGLCPNCHSVKTHEE